MNIFNKVNVTSLSLEIQKALNTVVEKHGLTVEWKNGRFTEYEFRKGFIIKAAAAPSKSESFQSSLALHFPHFVDKKIQLNNQQYTVIGYDSKKRKNKFIIQSLAGEKYSTSLETIHLCAVA